MNQDRLLSSSNLSTFLIFISFLILVSSCDNTGPTGQMESETESIENKFFSFTPDSVGPALTMAMDSLRQRSNAKPFIRNFIDERGIPSWDHYSIFPEEGQLVMLVPVIKTNIKEVAGIWVITLEQKQPVFQWIPRGAKLEGPKQPDKTALEIFMLGFEDRIFGKVQIPGLSVENKNSEIAKNKFGAPLMKSGWRRVPVDERCYRIDVGSLHGRNPEHTEAYLDYYRGNWECETIYRWVFIDNGGRDGGGSDDDGRDGSGGGNGGSSGSFAGTIEVDETIKRNDLTNCVYNKLRNSNTFNSLIAKFEGENSEFNLKFELAEVEGNAYGDLIGILPNFVARIDASNVTIRNGIEIASTFMHEAMHAEMRRYLRSQEDNGSTIPGFPGSFTEDWNNYVAEKYGKDPQDILPAEHQAMAEYFIGFLANGLQEFDNNQLDRKHYEALAWDGLTGTEAWDSANQNEISEYRYDDKIDNRPQQCSR